MFITRYVQHNTGQQSYSFHISLDRCGTGVEDGRSTAVHNTIVVQFDPLVQEVWDTARRLSCSWQDRYSKQVNFQPLSVSMLDVVKTEFRGEPLKCWMDIQRGIFPNTRPLEGVLPIGEPVSVMVYLEDENKKMDVVVRDCWALPSDDFDDSSLPRVQLTSDEGCTMKEKLMGPWTSVYDNLDSGTTLISYSTLSAFKFPDYSQIYLTCNVEICQSQCERRCVSKPTTSIEIQVSPPRPSLPRQEEVNCLPGSADIRCKQISTHENWCKSNRNHPKCRRNEEKTYDECPPGSSNPRCRNLTPRCEAGSNDPRCREAAIPPINCYEGSTDPRCLQESQLSVCGPGSTDERCQSVSVFVPDCSQTPFDPLCQRIEIVDEITFDCQINPADARCIQSSIERPRCYPGSNDPFCRTKLIPSKETSTYKRKKCRQNSNDPECSSVEVSQPPPFSIVVPDTPLQVFCPPGSTDPICSRQSQTLNCVLNPYDPNCSAGTTPATITQSDKCRLGSQDPKCTQAHRESTFQTKPTSKPFIPVSTTPYEESISPSRCAPGSKHPNCPRVVELPSELLICAPGTRDPRCPTFIRDQEIPPIEPNYLPREVECTPGSKNPRCLSGEIPYIPEVPKVPVYDETTYFNCLRNPNDRRCKIPQNERPEQSLEVSSERPKISQIKPPRCEIGSTDPNCVPRVPFVPEYAFECTKNSRDPRCQVSSERNPCEKNPNDPRCYEERVPIPPVPQPNTFPCTPNSKDPRCYTFTTQAPSFTTQLLCLGNRNDPRCYQSTTELPRIKSPRPFNKNECYFRPNDPRCKPDSPSQSSSECKPGSSDPLCNQPETFVSVVTPAIKPRFPNVPRPRVPDVTTEYSPTRPFNPSVPFRPEVPSIPKTSEEIPSKPQYPNRRPQFPNIRPKPTEKTVLPEEPFRPFEKPFRPQRPRGPVRPQVPDAPEEPYFPQIPYNSHEVNVPREPNTQVPIFPQETNRPRVPSTPREPNRPQESDVPRVPNIGKTPYFPRVPDIPRKTDSPRVPDFPQEPDIPRVTDINWVTDTPRVPNVPRVPNNPRVPDIPRVPGRPGVTDIPRITDFPRVPGIPDKQINPKITNYRPSFPRPPYVSQVPNIPQVPDIPQVPNIPQIPNIPQVPYIPKDSSEEHKRGNEQPPRFPKTTDRPRTKVRPSTGRPSFPPVVPKFPSTERSRFTRPKTQTYSFTTPQTFFKPSSSEEQPFPPFPREPFSPGKETSRERPRYPDEPKDRFPQRKTPFVPRESKEKVPREPINQTPIQIPHFSVPSYRTTVPYVREPRPTRRPTVFTKVPKQPNQSDERTTRRPRPRPRPDKEFVNSVEKRKEIPTTRRTPASPSEKTKFVPRRPSNSEEKPSRPKPSRPESSRPKPSRPEPSRPEPSRPEPSRPEPSRPEPSRPEPSRPEPSRPKPSRPEPSRPELSRPKPSRPEPSRPKPSRPEPSRPKPSRPEPSRPEPSRPEPSRPKPSRPEPSRPEPSRPEPSRPEPSRPEPSRPEPSRPEPSRPEPSRPKPSRPEPSRPEPSRPEPSRPDTPTKTPKESKISRKRPPGPPDQPNLERGESKVSTRRPETLPKKKRPMPDKSRMHGKDDHHGKGMDPRYHAFHSYLYQAAPNPRKRGRRALPETSMLVNVGARRLTVVPEATQTRVPSAATSHYVDEGRLFLQDSAGEHFKTFLLSDAEAFVEEVPINDDYDFISYSSTETELDGRGDDLVTSENVSNSVADYLSVKSTFQFIIAFSTITIIFITVMVITISTHKAIKIHKKTATLEL